MLEVLVFAFILWVIVAVTVVLCVRWWCPRRSEEEHITFIEPIPYPPPVPLYVK